jgi:hypothetical protein
MSQHHGPVDFTRLAAGFAASAKATLDHVEALLDGRAGPEGDAATPSGAAGAEERRKGAQSGLDSARHLIDTLSMLDEKTRGNLTAAEAGFLGQVLTDLRVAYVKVDDRARKELTRAASA